MLGSMARLRVCHASRCHFLAIIRQRARAALMSHDTYSLHAMHKNGIGVIISRPPSCCSLVSDARAASDDKALLDERRKKRHRRLPSPLFELPFLYRRIGTPAPAAANSTRPDGRPEGRDDSIFPLQHTPAFECRREPHTPGRFLRVMQFRAARPIGRRPTARTERQMKKSFTS